MPKLAIDETHEAEYFEIISGMAAQDKPVAWADKFITAILIQIGKTNIKAM
ncbi:MAG: hypothetical protein IPM74_15945 [Crocinitomicaceae bacterium]|nr:hypothetical protein [Crocinitomicaceae bacterium]